jgi:hypothetical protein
LLDDHAVLTAVMSVPGLLEEIIAHPALLAELGSGPHGELLEVVYDEDTATLPVRVFFADAPAWQRAAEDPEWRRRFLDLNSGGLSWAPHVVLAWNALSAGEQADALKNPGWLPEQAGQARQDLPWVYTEEESGSVWIQSTARSAPASAPAEYPTGMARPVAPTPQQAAVIAQLEQRGAFKDAVRFGRELKAARDRWVRWHGLVSVLIGPGKDRRTDGAHGGYLLLSGDRTIPFALVCPILEVPITAPTKPRPLVLTPDVVAGISSKVYPNDPILRFPSIPLRTILRTTARPGATDPPSAAEVHLFATAERGVTGLLRQHLGR